MKKSLAALSLLALAGAAVAQVDSTGDLASGGPILTQVAPILSTIDVTYTSAATYELASIDFSGMGTVIDAGTFGTDLDVEVFLNGGLLGTINLGNGTGLGVAGDTFSFAGNATFGFAGTMVNAGDVWGFGFLDTVDDPFGSANGTPDAQWDSITFDFNAPVVPDLSALAIGTLSLGSSVSGDTSASSNDLNGTTGSPFAGGNESGGDDVYEVDWAGGDFGAILDIIGTNPATGLPLDLDVFLYDSIAPAAPIGSGFSVDNPEEISIEGLAAGTYFLRVDGFLGDSGAYNLSVVPAPGAAALLGLAGLVGVRRRRA